MTDHWGRRYHDTRIGVWNLLNEKYNLDHHKYLYRLHDDPPVLYCDGERRQPIMSKEEVDDAGTELSI